MLIADGRNMASWRQKVNRWEKRGVRPEDAAQYVLAKELGVPRRIVDKNPWPSWLLFVLMEERTADPWTADTAAQALAGTLGALDDRRGFLILTDASLAHIAEGWTDPSTLPPDEKVRQAVEGGRIDTELAATVERRLADLWVVDDYVGGAQSARLADTDLSMVVSMLRRGTYSLDVERRLYAVAGGLCRMAGWGSFDGGRPAAAERYWHAGLRASKHADDVDGGIYILSNWAMQRFYAGDGHEAIALLDAAKGSLGHVSETVHAMLETWRVRAHANLGEADEAAKALMRAEKHWEQRRPEDDPTWIYWMQRPSTTIEPNLAMLQLEQPQNVESNLREWIDLDGHQYPRDHALALTVVGTAQLALGELDTAIGTGREALSLLRSIDSGRVGDELKEFLDKLPDDRLAREFREEVESN
ncbi:hypothetical protein [Actinocorallia libanotica]